MKCPVCSSEVKELYNLNTEADEFKCFGCHLRDSQSQSEETGETGE